MTRKDIRFTETYRGALGRTEVLRAFPATAAHFQEDWFPEISNTTWAHASPLSAPETFSEVNRDQVARWPIGRTGFGDLVTGVPSHIANNLPRWLWECSFVHHLNSLKIRLTRYFFKVCSKVVQWCYHISVVGFSPAQNCPEGCYYWTVARWDHIDIRTKSFVLITYQRLPSADNPIKAVDNSLKLDIKGSIPSLFVHS